MLNLIYTQCFGAKKYAQSIEIVKQKASIATPALNIANAILHSFLISRKKVIFWLPNFSPDHR